MDSCNEDHITSIFHQYLSHLGRNALYNHIYIKWARRETQMMRTFQVHMS